MITSNSLQI